MGVNGLYGLSGSGLDIESMVKAGMMSKQNQYDKMYKKEVKNEWLKQGFNEIYTSLNTFKYSTLSDYKMQSNMSAMKASSNDDKAVGAMANGAAVAMTHTVKVNGMSSNAYLLSNGPITREADDKQSSMYLKDVLFDEISSDHYYKLSGSDEYLTAEKITDDDGNVTYKLKKEDGSYVKDGDNDRVYTEEQFQSAIGSDLTDEGTKIRIKIGSEYSYVNEDDKAIKLVVRDSTESISEDDTKKQTVSYTFGDILNGKTLYDFAADVKGTGSKVQASYDASTDSFAFYNSAGGKDNIVAFDLAGAEDGGTYAAKLLNSLNLSRSENGTMKTIAETAAADPEKVVGNGTTFEAGKMLGVTGANGGVVIDGREYTDIEDNRITVAGVTYSLLDADPDKTYRVTVTQDTDKIIENVKKFVEDYNKILDDLTKKYNTKPDGDYEPLSKTQEAGMTQEQIDKWTEKAKSGLFYHNDILRGLISDMRDAIMTPVQSVHSKYNSASAIGITSENQQGHLTLDVDKLKKALAEDPDCVYELFASDQDTYSEAAPNERYSYMKTEDFNNRGIANRLYFNAVTDGIKKVEDYAGVLPDSNDQSTLGLLITQLKDKMTNFKSLMDSFQTQLYKKYDALETMIASLNSQYNTLFGGQQ